MSLYNIEIFTPEFDYRDSYQVQEISYEYDYLSLSNNKIKLPHIKAKRDDIIRISNGSQRICGIIESVSESDTNTTIDFRHFLTKLDCNVWVDLERYNDSSITVEAFISDMITQYFSNSGDDFQNIRGLEINASTETKGRKNLGLQENINNLYEILKQALVMHEIVVNVDIDVQKKKITLDVGRAETYERYIEADLANILDRNITIKKADESINKLYVINEENPVEQKVYFLAKNGEISETIEADKRINPVVFDTISTSPGKDETFEQAAFEEALSKLVREEYDNLIEITVLNSDAIVTPTDWSIGERAAVIHKGAEYHTILTGINIKQTKTTLIFGAVRLELTKLIKRRYK